MSNYSTRADIPHRWKWNLKHLVKDKAALKELEQDIKQAQALLATYKGKAAAKPLEAVKAMFDLNRLLSRYFVFSSLQRDQDAGNSAYKAQMGSAEALMVGARSAGAFLEPELLTLTQEQLTALRDHQQTPEYSVYFQDLIRKKPHVLPVEQEELLAKSGEVFSTASRVFGVLNNVDLPLPEVQGEDEQPIKLSNARYGMLIRSKKRRVRKAAFHGMMKAYKDFSSTLSTLYISSMKNDVLQAGLRGYKSSRAMSLQRNEIPEAVYDGLIKEAHRALPLLNRYLELRKKALKVDELHLYDLYVPIAEDFNMNLTYQQGFKLVKEGLEILGEDYGKLLDQAYTGGWIDVYETPGKRSGAYSWGCYDSHPYVLLNHSDNLDSAMTLAHELGHAMHSHMSNQAQPPQKAGYTLFAAEVASTCNEILVNHQLMQQHQNDKKASLFFLNNLAEGFRTTFFRQTMFAEFELAAHRLVEKGVSLTDQVLNELYLKLNETYYGRVCVIDPEIASEWMRIPHFYRAYYVYQYATGYSAAVFLADRIQKQGSAALKDYFAFLSSGGSLPAIDALKRAGADMTKPQVIRGAMKVFEQTIAQMEALI